MKYAVLIVEDDEALSRTLAEQLEGERLFSVSMVHTLREAVAVLKADDSKDAVILDLNLPDSHGLETVREVRMASFVPVIVVITGKGEEHKAAALAYGADAYLTKPFTGHELMMRVLTTIELAKVRLENQLVNSHISLLKKISSSVDIPRLTKGQT